MVNVNEAEPWRCAEAQAERLIALTDWLWDEQPQVTVLLTMAIAAAAAEAGITPSAPADLDGLPIRSVEERLRLLVDDLAALPAPAANSPRQGTYRELAGLRRLDRRHLVRETLGVTNSLERDRRWLSGQAQNLGVLLSPQPPLVDLDALLPEPTTDTERQIQAKIREWARDDFARVPQAPHGISDYDQLHAWAEHIVLHELGMWRQGSDKITALAMVRAIEITYRIPVPR